MPGWGIEKTRPRPDTPSWAGVYSVEAVQQASVRRTLRRQTKARDGTLVKLLPSFGSRPKCVLMQPDNPIPFYAADGRQLGVRTPEAAKRLIASGYAKAAYGRKGHLRAIWIPHEDGGTPVVNNVPNGTSYSYREHLDTGHQVWALRRLGKGEQLKPIFTRVLADCLVVSR